MQDWTIIDVAMRSAAIALCLYLGVQFLLARPFRMTAFAGVLFALSGGLYCFVSMPGFKESAGLWFFVVCAAGFPAAGLFWFFVASLVDEGFEPRPIHFALFAVHWLLYLPILPFAGDWTPYAKTLHTLGNLFFVIDALRRTVAIRAIDLVESRRDASLILICTLVFTGIVILALSAVETLQLRSPLVVHVQSITLLATSFGLCLALSGLRARLLPERRPQVHFQDAVNDVADRIELERLREAMTRGVYLESGLTIGTLVEKLNLPEHRLRRLINRTMGYRNFAEFINDHRIDEAKRRLADEDLAREQITGIAFDLGFASLAPFNKAFRERTGMSPSEFRQRALATLN